MSSISVIGVCALSSIGVGVAGIYQYQKCPIQSMKWMCKNKTGSSLSPPPPTTDTDDRPSPENDMSILEGSQTGLKISEPDMGAFYMKMDLPYHGEQSPIVVETNLGYNSNGCNQYRPYMGLLRTSNLYLDDLDWITTTASDKDVQSRRAHIFLLFPAKQSGEWNIMSLWKVVNCGYKTIEWKTVFFGVYPLTMRYRNGKWAERGENVKSIEQDPNLWFTFVDPIDVHDYGNWKFVQVERPDGTLAYKLRNTITEEKMQELKPDIITHPPQNLFLKLHDTDNLPKYEDQRTFLGPEHEATEFQLVTNQNLQDFAHNHQLLESINQYIK